MSQKKNIYYGYDMSLHQAQVLVGDPKALAYEWIVRYAKSISRPAPDNDEDDDGYEYYGTVYPEELIETAMRNIHSEGWGDYISKGELLEGVSVDPVFWDKLAIFTGTEIPYEKRENFFSCAC